MLCLLILCILQSTLTGKRTTHASRVTYYWQTVDPTDQVVDYWNHGPDLGKVINEKKFQVFTLTTKRPDIFPPWLTRGTTERAITLLPSRVFLRTRATPKKTTTATTADVLRQREAESTDPFSVFLRKLFKVLTRKPYLELQMLVGPFVHFMTVLLENRFLNWFGKNVTEYVGKTLKNIERSSPSMLHEKCKQAYKALSKRSTVLDADINELLDLVDDIFDAAEEETMQDVLQHVLQYPNTSKSAEALVHDLIDAVVFEPVTRVNGTLKGDHLIKILSEVVANRKINSRRNMYDIDMYDLVRLNVENIRKNVNKMNDSPSSEESKEVKILRSQIKTTKIVKNKGLETKNIIKNLINNLEHLQTIIDKLEIPSASNEYDIEYSDRSEGDLLKRNKRKTVQPTVFHFKPSDENILRKDTLRVDKRYSEKHNVGFETTTDYIRLHSKQKSMDNPKKVYLSKNIFDTLKRDVSILKMRRPITQPVARSITYPSPNLFKIPNTTAKSSNDFGRNNNFNIDSELHLGKKEKLREQHSLPGGAEIHTTEVEHSTRYIGIENIPRKKTLRVHTRLSEKHNVGFETTTDYIRQHSKHKSIDNPKKFSLSKDIFDTIKRDVSILKMRRPITQPVARTITYPSPNLFKIPNTTAKPSNEFGSNNTFNIDSELHMGKKEKLREQHSLPGGAKIHTTEVEHSTRYIGIENIPRKKTLRVHTRLSEKHNVGFETTTDYIRQHSKHKSIDNPKKFSLSKDIFDTIKRDVSILKMRRPITQPVSRTITYPSPHSFKTASTTAKPSNEFGSNNNYNIDSELHMGNKEKLMEQHSLPGGAEIHTTEAEHSSRYIGDQSQDKQDPLFKTTQPQKALKTTKRQTRKQVKIVPSHLENKKRKFEIVHGETHHNRKKKYHRLKHKYERLKEITNMILRGRDSNEELDAEASRGQFDKKAEEINLNANIAKIEELRDTLVKNFKELLKVSKGMKENFPESTTVKKYRKLKINKLLDDEWNINNQNDVFNSKNEPAEVLSGKTLLQSKAAGYVTTYSTTEFSRKKIELKNNIFNSFRRSNNAALVIQSHNSQSQETDLEPVLKSNIYKAVKETLKNSTLKPL